MTRLDAKALEAAWTEYMAGVYTAHPLAKVTPLTPEQQMENQSFVCLAIRAYLDALPQGDVMTTYSTPPQNEAIEALRKIEAIAKGSHIVSNHVQDYAFAMGQIQHIAWRAVMRNDTHAKETV